MRKFFLLPLVAMATMLLAGCAGYKLGPVKPTYMKHVKTIAVPSFRNETLIPRVEVMMANSVIKQLQQDGTYQVADVKDADAILDCVIAGVDRQAARSLRGNVLATTEYNLQLKIVYTLTDRSTGKPLVQQRTVIGTTSFFVGGDVLQDEQQALPLASEQAAIQIVNQISEGW